MSKYDLMKNIYKKNSSKSTADSSKPQITGATRYTDTGSGGQTKKVSTKSPQSQATYWQATQQTANKQATAQKQKAMGVKRRTLTGSQKRQAQQAEREKRTRYSEAVRNAQKFDPSAQQDYSQANAGIRALFSGRNVASAMRDYSNQNRKQLEQERLSRQAQANYAQASIDKARTDINGNDLAKTLSDLGMKGLGGLTSNVGGLIRTGSNVVQGFAGLANNQDLARAALQFDRNLGTDEAIANINRENSQANTIAGKVSEAIGGMIPTIAGNLVGGQAAGLGAMGASVFGNSGSEAFENLSSDGDLSRSDAARALGYGGLNAGLEVGTEMLSSLIPGLETFAFTNPDHLLGQAGGEALEEMLSTAAEPLIAPLANQNVQNAQQYAELVRSGMFTEEQLREILASGALGAATSLAMGAPANITNTFNNLRQVRNDIQWDKYLDDLVRAWRSSEASFADTNDYAQSINDGVPFNQLYAQIFGSENRAVDPVIPEPGTLSDPEGIAPEYLPNEFTPSAPEAEEILTTNDFKARSERRKRADYRPSDETFDMDYDDYVAAMIRASDVSPASPQTPEPIVRELTARQRRDVADEYRVNPTDDVTQPVVPEDAYAQVSNEDTISDGEFRPAANSDALGEGEDLEYVPTGESVTDARGMVRAAIKADPSDTQKISEAYGEGIKLISEDAESVPDDVAYEFATDEMADIDRLTHGEKVTQGAEKLSEKRGSGVSQENITKESADEYKKRVAQMSSDVVYRTTNLDALTASAKEIYDRLGESGTYDDWMSKEPKTNLLSKLKGGIGTDYETSIFVAEGQYLADRIEVRKSDILDKVKDLGLQAESFTDTAGQTSYRLVDQNGKEVSTDEANDYVKQLTEATSRVDAIYRRLNNISHNAGLLLRQFWFRRMSPASQVKGIQDNVNKINDELRNRFGKEMKSGKYSPVTLNENTVQEYLKASTEQEKMQLMDQMAEDIASQVPHSLMEKIDAFRYNNMLFNPLTFVRNGVGNGLQAQMAKVKDLNLYFIESIQKLTGNVRYNNLDMTNASDQALYNHAVDNAGKTLSNDLAEARKQKKSKRYLRELGYEGAALHDLSKFKGKTLMLSMTNPVLNSRMNEVLANTAKEAGYTVSNGQLVDKNGNAITGKEYSKLVSDSYNKASKQWLSSESLRAAKTDGVGKGKAVKSQRELFQKEGFDLLNQSHVSVSGMQDTSTNMDDAFRRRVNEYRRKNVFKDSNPFGWTENRISRAIDYMMNENAWIGDDGFLRRGYGKNMAMMLDAQGYKAEIAEDQIHLYDRQGNLVDQVRADEILNRVNRDAYQRALEDTYHDVNRVADTLNELSRNSSGAKIILDALLPFTRTPMNIVRRAVEYSPLGLVKSMSQIKKVKTGQISAETWLNNMAKGTTGAGAVLIGAFLASLGILRGNGDEEDKNVTRYESAHGVQNYSLQFGDWSATLDWAAPGISPFLLGAVMQEVTEKYHPAEDEGIAKTTWNLMGNYAGNLGALFQPIADTTMLSGLMETLSAFGEDDPLAEVIASATESYVRQLTPALGSKLAGIWDPTKYSTYSDNFFDRQLRASAINFRLLDWAISAYKGEQYLQPQLDPNGQPIQTQDYGLGAWGRAITNLANPATVKENTLTNTDDELVRLYKATGNTGVLAQQRYYIDNYKFTPQERAEFNQYYLPEYTKAAEEFIKSPSYQNLDDAERAKVLGAMSKHLQAEAQVRYLGKVVPNSGAVRTVRDEACNFVVSKGVTTAKFYQYYTTPFVQDKDGNNISNTRAMQVRAQMEADGIWDDVLKAIEDEKFKPSDFYLTIPVVKWDESKFTYNYDLMLNGSYSGKN